MSTGEKGLTGLKQWNTAFGWSKSVNVQKKLSEGHLIVEDFERRFIFEESNTRSLPASMDWQFILPLKSAFNCSCLSSSSNQLGIVLRTSTSGRDPANKQTCTIFPNFLSRSAHLTLCTSRFTQKSHFQCTLSTASSWSTDTEHWNHTEDREWPNWLYSERREVSSHEKLNLSFPIALFLWLFLVLLQLFTLVWQAEVRLRLCVCADCREHKAVQANRRGSQEPMLMHEGI